MICQPGRHNRATRRVFHAASLLLFLTAGLLAGCGTPAAPLAPTLKLPEPPKDLSAIRSENKVHLKWTMPRRSTDNILLQGNIGVYVWRTPGSGKGELIGDLSLAPGLAGELSDQLPPRMQTGSPSPISYTVELLNHLGHSAGLSNIAYSAAGVAPTPVRNLSAGMAKDGVHLHWQNNPSEAPHDLLRIHRKLLDPAADRKASLESSGPEPGTLTLLVKPKDGQDRGEALDSSAHFSRHYEYWIERVEQPILNGHSIEVLSAPSNTVQVETKDVFPPRPPQQLAAVAVEGEHVIDLSWSPNTEADLAGYVVYRSEAGGAPERVSSIQTLLVAPSFRDMSALPGHRYSYSVSALDTSGNESSRSAEAEESLPQ